MENNNIVETLESLLSKQLANEIDKEIGNNLLAYLLSSKCVRKSNIKKILDKLYLLNNSRNSF